MILLLTTWAALAAAPPCAPTFPADLGGAWQGAALDGAPRIERTIDLDGDGRLDLSVTHPEAISASGDEAIALYLDAAPCPVPVGLVWAQDLSADASRGGMRDLLAEHTSASGERQIRYCFDGETYRVAAERTRSFYEPDGRLRLRLTAAHWGAWQGDEGCP